jgi:hypothetical protein
MGRSSAQEQLAQLLHGSTQVIVMGHSKCRLEGLLRDAGQNIFKTSVLSHVNDRSHGWL